MILCVSPYNKAGISIVTMTSISAHTFLILESACDLGEVFASLGACNAVFSTPICPTIVGEVRVGYPLIATDCLDGASL